MANIIIPKRSTVAGKVPVTGDLVTGEIAINLTDKKLYSKDGSGAIVEIGGGSVDLLNVTTGIASPDYIQFDTSATNTAAVGKLYWDAGEGSFLYTLSGGNVTQNLHPGSELVYNGTGAALTKGQVVYLSGAQGHRPSVALALASSESTSARTIGIVAETIANGAEGWIRTAGILEGFDTSSFTDGSQLYLSGTTAGAMTATKPVAPIHLVYTARVIKSHATAGRILVGIQNGYELDEIHDVAISSPSTGQTIVYNSTTSLWSNGTLPVAGGGTGATSLTSGYLVKGNGTSAASASVVYDDGTNVGIGTSSPSQKLVLEGASGVGLQIQNSSDSSRGGRISATGSAASGTFAVNTTSSGYALTFGIDTTERMRLDTSGNVGIGTSSPGAKLDVAGNSYFRSDMFVYQNGGIFFNGNGSYGGAGIFSRNTGSDLILAANGGEGARLTATGFGIGTSSPGHKLDVTGSAGTFAGIRISSAAFQDAGFIANRSNSGNSASLYFTEAGANVAAIHSRGGSYGSGLNGALQIVNGSNSLTYDSSGNLGLGVTPSAWAGTLVKAFQIADNGASFSSYSTGNTSGKFAILSNNAYYDAGGWKYAQTAASAQYRVANQEHQWFTAPSGTAGNAISFTQAMTLHASGGLSVGTASDPGAGNFTLYGSGNSSLTVNGAGGTGSINLVNGAGTQTISGGVGGANNMTFAVGGTERMRIDSSGNVGIGTSSPTAYSGYTSLEIDNASNGGILSIKKAGSVVGYLNGASGLLLLAQSNDLKLTTTGSTSMQFSTNATERMRIDASGNLLVGKTAASVGTDGVQLIAGGFSGFSAPGTTALFLNRNTNDGTILEFGRNGVSAATMGLSSSALTFGTAGSERMRISSAGNVGIGTTSPSAKLHIVGNINLDGISVRDTATTTTTATTQVALATFAGATYDSAEVIIKAKQGTAVHITKLLVVYDGTTASATEFGAVLSGSSLFTTDVDVSSGSVTVLITPTSATSTVFKASYELITA